MALLFEWNPDKALSNCRKHHVRFEEACEIWKDPFYYRIRVSSEPEERWLAVGRVSKSSYLSAIVTYRGEDGETVRIISARRSTRLEIERYHG